MRHLSATGFSLWATLLTLPAHATTWYVAADGSGDFVTIQAGVVAAAAGDSILVAPGTYLEDVQIGEAITVLSEAGPSVTTVQGTTTFRIYYVLEGTANLEGFTISGTADAIDTYFSTVHIVGNVITGAEVGVKGRSSTLTIAHNDVRNQTGPGLLLSGSTVTVTGNTIESNGTSNGFGGGIQSSHSVGMIQNNMVRGNRALEGGGMWLGPSSDLDVMDNHIVGNGSHTTHGGGITVSRGDARLTGNLILENTGSHAGGVWVDHESVVDVITNTVVANEGDGAAVAIGNATVTFERNIFAMNEGNVAFRRLSGAAATDFECNIFWHPGPDAPGLGIDIPLGVDGNLTTDPAFCDVRAQDFRIDRASPAAEAQSPQGCGRIGAFDPACGTDGHVLIQGGLRQLDGSPLAGALVVAGGTMPAQDSTDAHGRFRLDVIPGDYVLTALHAGDDLWPETRTLDGVNRSIDGQNFFVVTTPRVLRVTLDGTGDATTVQGGIDLAQPFDTVRVAPATYAVADLHLRGLPIIVRSETGPAETILEGEYPGRSAVWARDGEPVEATLEGFTIRRGRETPVRIEFGSGLTLRGCVLTENDDVQEAVVLAMGEGRLEQNLIVGHPRGAAIELAPLFQGSARRNLLVDNALAMRVDADVRDSVGCNILWQNDENAISGLYPIPLGENGNVAIDPHFCDGEAGDYTLNHASPCLPGQHPLGDDCGRVGPFGIGCTDGPLYYVIDVDPTTAPYTGSTAITMTGWNFPGSVSATLDLDGAATRPIVLDTVTGSRLEGTIDLYEAPPGLWDVVVADGGEEARLVDSFCVPSVAVASLEPDTVSTSSPSDTIGIHGSSFLPGINAWFTNQLGEVEVINVLERTEDMLRVVYEPLGRRGYRALVVANASVETLTVNRALWVEDVPRTLRVPADFPTIQEGITASIDGDTVLVAPGEYHESLRIFGKNVCLRSEAGPEQTVLDGDRSRQILVFSQTDSTTTVEGFTFIDGFTEHSGGAIVIYHPATARISGNVFRNNVAYVDNQTYDGGEGGAIFVGGSGEIEGNVFEGNLAGLLGGGIAWNLYRDSRSVVIRDNLFLRNDSEQGAAMAGFPYDDVQTIMVEGNTFVDNVGWTQVSIEGSFELNRNIFAMVDRIPSEHEMALACVIPLPTASAARALDQKARPFMADIDATWEFERTASCNLVSFIEEDCLPRPEWDCEGFEATDTFCGVDPLFCEPEFDDYRLGPRSPIHPDSTDCGRIGAFGPCVIVPSEEAPPTGHLPIPVRWALGTPTPNPFNPFLRIPVAVPSPGGQVAIRVFDSAGRLVRVLVDEPLDPGHKVVVWDGRTASGAPVASGVYFLRMEAPGFRRSRSAILLR